jgi:CheY-like chemotaxis protein
MSKTALIVDDSQLARHVLGQLLAEHGLTADTALSAEAALEYLKQRRPDVIFMDHMMPGMDGFEALEAIKANPATATIPVMMYTSQEGELYVGQARALGAFGVLPKDLKPVEVARVLKALHLLPAEAEPQPDRAPASGETGAADATDSHRVKELLEELFYQQRAALREEIRDGYQRAIASQKQLEAVDPAPPQLQQQRWRIGVAERHARSARGDIELSLPRQRPRVARRGTARVATEFRARPTRRDEGADGRAAVGAYDQHR